MAFDPLGWLGGAVGGGVQAVDKFFGGTGGESVSSPSTVSTDEYGTQTDASVGFSDATGGYGGYVAPAADSVVANVPQGEYDYVGSGMDKTERHEAEVSVAPKELSSIVSQTEEPMHETGVDSIISRADYVALSDLGDRKTQELIRGGLDPVQALEQQRLGALESGDIRAANYYQNERDKAAQSNVGLASEYHHDALDSGLPTAVNPFEYTGDISAVALKGWQDREWADLGANKLKSTSVHSIEGTFPSRASELAVGLGYSPSFMEGRTPLEMANIIAKTKAEGDLGPYGALKATSVEGGVERVLDLSEQQRIGYNAATSPFNKEGGWEVKPELMSKYTPDLVKGLGYGDKTFVEAKVPEKGFDWTANKRLLAGETTSGILGISKEGVAEKRGATQSLETTINPDLKSIDAYTLGGKVPMLSALPESKAEAKSESKAEAKLDLTPELIGKYGGAVIGGTIGAVTAGGPTGVVGGAIIGGATKAAPVIFDKLVKGVSGLLSKPKEETKVEAKEEMKEERRSMRSEMSPVNISAISVSPSGIGTTPVVTDYVTVTANKAGIPLSGEPVGGKPISDWAKSDITVPPVRNPKFWGEWKLREITQVRKPKRSMPFTHRNVHKHSVKINPVTKPKKFNLDVINGIVTDASIYKATIPSVNIAIKSVGVSVKNSELTKSKKVVTPSLKSAINIVDKKKKNIVNNIENIVETVSKPAKIKKLKVK